MPYASDSSTPAVSDRRSKNAARLEAAVRTTQSRRCDAVRWIRSSYHRQLGAMRAQADRLGDLMLAHIR